MMLAIFPPVLDIMRESLIFALNVPKFVILIMIADHVLACRLSGKLSRTARACRTQETPGEHIGSPQPYSADAAVP
jgi:hypothetical protein